jgi:hypothetical protein
MILSTCTRLYYKNWKHLKEYEGIQGKWSNCIHPTSSDSALVATKNKPDAVSMLFQCKHLAVVIQGPIDVKGTSFEDSQHERMGWIMKLDVQQCWYCLGNPTPAESTEDWQKATTSQCRHWITISMSWIKAQKQAHTHTHLLWSWWDRPNPLIP